MLQLQSQLGQAAEECRELSQSSGTGSVDLKGKVVYDENDPARPR